MSTHKHFFSATAVLALAMAGGAIAQRQQSTSGDVRTLSSTRSIDRQNAFFRPIGKAMDTTCEYCHFETEAWGLSTDHIRRLFNSSQGKHGLFTPPSANDFRQAAALSDKATLTDRQNAYSLLLTKGDALVRRNFDPNTADFSIVAVIDPSLPAALRTIAVDDDGNVVNAGSAGSTLAIPGSEYLNYTAQANAGTPQIWIHRRPLPTTNFRFLTTVAWDGQDTRQDPNPARRSARDGVFDVTKATIRGRQTTASLVAADGHTYSDGELTTLANEMTDFMFSLTTAQENLPGNVALDQKGASGGVTNLAKQKFYFGINDVVQGDLEVSPTGQVTANRAPFNPNVFDLFSAWFGDRDDSRAAVERGQALFNAERLTIDNVGGVNGAQITLPDGTTVQGPPGPIRGSCSGCHNTPNVGNHSTRLGINIGVSDKAPLRFGRERVSDLPLFVLRRKSDGAIAQTTDPGRAVISGRFEHIGQFKGPILRGVSAHPPFFHNGMAATLEELVDFYDVRFKADFSAQEKASLVAFLKAL